MVSHSYHPDSHEFGLADDCERCEQHAENPFISLDDRNLLLVADRVIDGEKARSGNEATAMMRVQHGLRLHKLLQARQITSIQEALAD